MLQSWSDLGVIAKSSLIICALAAWLLVRQIWRVIADPLRDVPGPFLARFTRFWELYHVRQSNFEELNIQLHKDYGPIVRLGPGRYSINDAAAAKTMYAPANKFPKSSFYYPFGNPDKNGADLFNGLDIAEHSAKRRRVANLYSLTTLLSYEQYIHNQSAILCEKLRSFASSESVIDVPTWMQLYAFDVIGEMTVGESFGFMEAGYDEIGILKAIHDGSVYGSRVGIFSELHHYLGLMVGLFKLEIPFDVVLRFISRNIALRRSGEKSSDRADFLSKLLTLRQADKLQEIDVVTTMGANIAAGSDTTAISLSSVIYNLTTHPDCLAKLRAEIKDFTARGALSHPTKYAEAQRMPYLQAIIMETLRLHPATGQPLTRVVPSGGTRMLDRLIPAGTVVGVNPWVLHRNADIYGSDADRFRPERWLEASTEEKSRYESNFLSFGMGARTCLGKNISLLEMSIALPEIYRSVDFSLVDGEEYQKENVWFVKPKFVLRIKPRDL